MASIVTASAARSTVSVFESVGKIAETATKTLNVAAHAVDALDAKARIMSLEVTQACAAREALISDRATDQAALEHTRHLEEVHRSMQSNEEFDFAATFNQVKTKLEANLNKT